MDGKNAHQGVGGGERLTEPVRIGRLVIYDSSDPLSTYPLSDSAIEREKSAKPNPPTERSPTSIEERRRRHSHIF